MIYIKHKILQAYLKFAVYDDALDFHKGRRLHQHQQIFHSIIFITTKVIMGKFNRSIHLSQLKMKIRDQTKTGNNMVKGWNTISLY